MLKKSTSEATTIDLLQQLKNDEHPIRIALLGGAKSGKTSIISKLSLGSFRDTYYPTHQTQPILFEFTPVSFLSRCILDENDVSHALSATKNPNLIISPVIYRAFSRSAPQKPATEDININSSNYYYTTFRRRSSSSQYTPPEVTPILVELIDTASFNPDQVVPFLEASLYVNLDREILKNLANEPRRPVSTNPLLVASGASELNGAVDGYFFVYSAIPSYSPPPYHESEQSSMLEPTATDLAPSSSSSSTSTQTYQSLDGSTKTLTIENTPGDTTFNLLSIMKVALNEAWKEYNTYKTRWEEGQESDIFSIKSALKNMWKQKSLAQLEASRKEIRANLTNLQLIDNSVNPADPNCPPPIWVICTHSQSPLVSPKLIEDGKKLSKFWNCGFIAVDVSNETIDEALALIIREIVERKKLQDKARRKK